MVQNLVGFNLNGVRLDLSENGVDQIRPDCQILVLECGIPVLSLVEGS
jgi:hypothetical protein